jgi:hypothetical protein
LIRRIRADFGIGSEQDFTIGPRQPRGQTVTAELRG